MKLQRILRHVAYNRLATRRAFPPATLQRIRDAIATSEQSHRGEIRFVVEGEWPWSPLLNGMTTRERALELFSRERVWDTEENTGILFYVLLAEHQIEIIADRGIHARVGSGAWESICQQMQQDFARGDYEKGSLEAVGTATRLLAEHFPANGENPNELSDQPVLL